MSYPAYPPPDPERQPTAVPYPQAAEGFPRYGRAASPSGAAPPGHHYPPPPRPLRVLGRAATWIAIVVTVVEIVEAALAWQAQSRYAEAADRGESWVDVWTPYDLAGIVWFVAMVAAYVITSLWMHRARTNSAVMQPHLQHARSPGWAWGGWICPVVNLWFPFQIIRDVGRDQHGMRAAPSVGAWWTFWLLSSLVGQAASQLLGTTEKIDRDLVFVLGPAETLSAVLSVVALVLWLRIIRAVSHLQDQMMSVARPLPT